MQFVLIVDVFKGRHFDRQIIVLCVGWCTSLKLSLRDLVIMMADRGISVTHTTILRSVQRYVDMIFRGSSVHRLQQSEASECLLNRRDLLWRTRILVR